MPKTISNLLVGIGFDLDKDSTKKVSSGIDNVKSKALQLGGIVAGAFGIKALTSDFADAKDDLGKFADVMGVSANNGKPYIPTQDIKAAIADESRLLMHMDQDGRLSFVDPDNKDLWDEYIKNGATQAEVDQVKGNLEKARTKTKENLENGISARLKFEEKFDKPPAPKAFSPAELEYSRGLKTKTTFSTCTPCR